MKGDTQMGEKKWAELIFDVLVAKDEREDTN